MSAAKRIVHIRKVDVGGEGSPRRSTYEVFYPAGKGRKHAEDVRRLVEAVIRAVSDSDRNPEGEDPKGLSAEHESAVAKPIAQDLSVSGNP
jgi:hypothetical protein